MAAALLCDPVAAPSAQHLPFRMTPAPPVQRPERQPGPAAAGQARGYAEGSPGKFIKHLKWIMTRPVDQVLERNCTLKCRDENKDKRTRRRVVIRPCQL
ncbi:dexamethasone-induced protein isoform X1 [Motacilla alba alba]|uniref:dexamethasone-induced protein isoform X1 n=1 Tax=Motacilla alba alba TaxID=1094192 RepID=UPI0018D546C5|nr:dexamethasone-induced protein isoform X1 [Motacilla alba alba]